MLNLYRWRKDTRILLPIPIDFKFLLNYVKENLKVTALLSEKVSLGSYIRSHPLYQSTFLILYLGELNKWRNSVRKLWLKVWNMNEIFCKLPDRNIFFFISEKARFNQNHVFFLKFICLILFDKKHGYWWVFFVDLSIFIVLLQLILKKMLKNVYRLCWYTDFRVPTLKIFLLLFGA